MTEVLTAYFITEENLARLKSENEAAILPSVAGSPIEFKVGKVIVVQTIKTADLFDESFACTRENSWLSTRREFDQRFIISDEVSEDFAIIARK